MKFSIITPLKNSEKYIMECIESVINQRGDFDLEYFLMDGESKDRTLEICEDYKAQFDNGTRTIFCKSIDFKIISNKDGGMYEALSNGLSKVTGDIISYINADDFYLPNAFGCVNEIIKKYSSVNWLTGLPIRYNEDGQIINFRIPWKYNSHLILNGFYGKQLPFIQQESVFWRRECNEHINLEKLKDYRLAGDYFLWHSFARCGFQLFLVYSFLGGNRLRNGQLSENKKGYFKEFDSIKTKSHFTDKLITLFYTLIEKFAGKPIKRRLSRNTIFYKNGKWVLN